MAMLREEPPKKVSGLRVASVGGEGDDHPSLGCPIEYIDLRGSTPENPAAASTQATSTTLMIGRGAGPTRRDAMIDASAEPAAQSATE